MELTDPFGVKVFICKALNTKKVSVALKKYQKVERTMQINAGTSAADDEVKLLG